jgi:hypothetical protein
MHAALTFCCQFILVIEVFYELINFDGKDFTKEVNSSWVLFARFICTTILHLSLIDEVY